MSLDTASGTHTKIPKNKRENLINLVMEQGDQPCKFILTIKWRIEQFSDFIR